jgi:hypothetical protein
MEDNSRDGPSTGSGTLTEGEQAAKAMPITIPMTKLFVFTLAKIEKIDVIQKAPPKFGGAVARYRSGRDAINRVSTNPDGLFNDELAYGIRRLIAHVDEIHI